MTTSPICVDASLLLRLFIPHESGASVHALWHRWLAEHRIFVAPKLLFYEVTNALHQYARHGILTDEEAQQILQKVIRLDIALIENPYIHQRALQMAQIASLKATYDAHYLAVAEQAHAEFWTADARLVKNVGSKWPWVHGV